jgi:hypothetical protein
MIWLKTKKEFMLISDTKTNLACIGIFVFGKKQKKIKEFLEP